MAVGGGVASGGSARADLYRGHTTKYVILACIVAASGGLIFGYDVGISGGVTSMDDFLEKFFPGVKRHKDLAANGDSDYCKYDNQKLQAFTSSLYLAGLVASFLASHVTKKYGRRPSIICGGLSFLVGAVLNGAAANLVMLILGRIMLGVGVGFGNQAVPVYLSEMAPAKIRGALNIMFQLAITIGILCANLINYGTAKIPGWGWRLSLGLAGVPAILMSVGGLFLPETPNSLIERGRCDEGRRLLVKIRGTEEVDAEYEDIKEASDLAAAIASPLKNIFERRSRPQLILATLIPFFQQFTGINAIMFYAPVLFQTIGFGSDASLYSAVITGAVNVVATLVSIALVDRLGRRFFFLQAGVQMFVSQVVVAVILGVKFGGTKELDKVYAVIVVIVICCYVSAFAWSWGPLGWLVPSEIFPLETRSAGQAITVAVNLFFTFVIAQAFLSMMCHMKFGIFLFFAAWVAIMSVFVFWFIPETKNVPIEEMMGVWRKHWFWRRIVPDQDPPVIPYKQDDESKMGVEMTN
ncbi:hypothetical protein SELMODRAFT_402035 [Selaginella moellendorffii]|uniref:Major facilitator superfamily (MFS) profile domain-containing protein n=1 Tax=Selaginella moellendorffii TaxID=88036 RepID=D8QPD7_SELML|nr:sugar transport protein 7 [Selaginella moellendorffii]XP_024544788.1 sugar transport protein 7-like [Selaginella moellendorffii]EFJ37602.1 hypothetical protein SELMODRAFT_402035 [Selaginella moellendorffii]|eukprot:XP_002960063.1 sugar transport protein 7 [Selaginella moellendorffii]